MSYMKLVRKHLLTYYLWYFYCLSCALFCPQLQLQKLTVYAHHVVSSLCMEGLYKLLLVFTGLDRH
jgi:hypothetical protein